METSKEAKFKVDILELEAAKKLPTLATFKARVTIFDEPFGTFPGMRLVKGVEGSPDFVAPQDHYHFKIKQGKDKGKTHYVHCYYLYQNVYDAILPHAMDEFKKLEAQGKS